MLFEFDRHLIAAAQDGAVADGNDIVGIKKGNDAIDIVPGDGLVGRLPGSLDQIDVGT